MVSRSTLQPRPYSRGHILAWTLICFVLGLCSVRATPEDVGVEASKEQPRVGEDGDAEEHREEAPLEEPDGQQVAEVGEDHPARADVHGVPQREDEDHAQLQQTVGTLEIVPAQILCSPHNAGGKGTTMRPER